MRVHLMPSYPESRETFAREQANHAAAVGVGRHILGGEVIEGTITTEFYD